MRSLNRKQPHSFSKFIKCDGGFSIVEGLITMGILIMVMTLSLQLLNTSDRGWHSILRNQEQNALTEEIRVTLSNANTCAKNFGGKPISLNPAGNTVTMNELSSYDPDGKKGPTLIAVGQQRGNLIPRDITLRSVAQVDVGHFLANLTLSTQMVGAPPDKTTPRNITILLTLQGGLIINCRTGLSYESELDKKSCSIGSDGEKKWDPRVQRCVSVTPATVVYGTPFLATCPEGTALSGGSGSCYHSDLPPGYQDNYPPIERTYDDGITLRSPPALAVCRREGTTACTCQYATGVDPNIFKARVECIPI